MNLVWPSLPGYRRSGEVPFTAFEGAANGMARFGKSLTLMRPVERQYRVVRPDTWVHLR